MSQRRHLRKGDFVSAYTGKAWRIGRVTDTDGHWCTVMFMDGTFVDRQNSDVIYMPPEDAPHFGTVKGSG